ncbi:MAG: hypothetical protein ACFCGT_04185 [Sandaracinaceae bacterium]
MRRTLVVLPTVLLLGACAPLSGVAAGPMVPSDPEWNRTQAVPPTLAPTRDASLAPAARLPWETPEERPAIALDAGGERGEGQTLLPSDPGWAPEAPPEWPGRDRGASVLSIAAR